MKKILIYSISIMSLVMSSCNDIAPDDRYIEVAPTKVERAVLLEDFTGQNCINCPAAHRIIEALESQYGDAFIPVSIHAGHFGISATNTRYTGLMQQEGQTYCDQYGIIDFPKGVIDGQTPPLDADKWASAVYDEISVATPVAMSLNPVYDAESGNIVIDCEVSTSQTLDGNLVVWVVESGIVARQEDKDQGRIPDYVHNNVFRACVNGIDGTPIVLGPRENITEQFTIAAKVTATETWNIDNLSIVAFVKTSAGVEQACRANVKK